MYYFKDGIDTHFNKTKASEKIGITRCHLSYILNRKRGCPKTLAYCITKFLNQNAEISDYFYRKEK